MVVLLLLVGVGGGFWWCAPVGRRHIKHAPAAPMGTSGSRPVFHLERWLVVSLARWPGHGGPLPRRTGHPPRSQGPVRGGETTSRTSKLWPVRRAFSKARFYLSDTASANGYSATSSARGPRLPRGEALDARRS